VEVQPSTNSSLTVGDLEPSLDLLELLLSSDAIKDDVDLFIDKEPVASLFDFELGTFKPPPPPPTPPPPKARAPKRKIGRPPKDPASKGKAADKSKSTAKPDDLDASPGFRAPRTRRALASVAHESETVSEQSSSIEVPSNGHGVRLKRSSSVLPGRSQVPPMVDHVDNQRSFKMFNAGWIFPPDQKRGGRAPVERNESGKKSIGQSVAVFDCAMLLTLVVKIVGYPDYPSTVLLHPETKPYGQVWPSAKRGAKEK
jgi:hypothetical protein